MIHPLTALGEMMGQILISAQASNTFELLKSVISLRGIMWNGPTAVAFMCTKNNQHFSESTQFLTPPSLFCCELYCCSKPFLVVSCIIHQMRTVLYLLAVNNNGWPAKQTLQRGNLMLICECCKKQSLWSGSENKCNNNNPLSDTVTLALKHILTFFTFALSIPTIDFL